MNWSNLIQFFWPFFVSFILAFIVTPLVIKNAGRLKIIDEPEKNKRPKDTHTYPVPRGGGLPIFVALVISALLFLPSDYHLLGILAGAFLTLIIGLLDDRFDLNPYLRLLTCLFVALVAVWSGLTIGFVNNPLGGGILNLAQPQLYLNLFGQEFNFAFLAAIATVLWITWCMNFIGWSGGVEGQLPGLVVIAAATIGFLSLRYSADITQWPVMTLAAITAGSYLGFLPYNFYPQKIMPGYSGKSLAGFLLAILSILVTAKVGTLLVVLGVPLLDAIYSMTRRIAKGKSPFWGDRGHLHHRLLDLGWGKRRIVAFYWTLTAFLGFLALNLNSRQKFYTMVMLAVFLGALLLWLSYFTKSRGRPDQPSG